MGSRGRLRQRRRSPPSRLP
uniref:Uncharacterized protein n=1 Tax=Arundo donax TaxID=35708 RepID=A0A0A8YFJ3_ARUDO